MFDKIGISYFTMLEDGGEPSCDRFERREGI